MSFFLLRGDHVLVVEQDLTTSMLERYLRWLLCTRTKTALRDARVQLVPKIFLDGEQHVLKEVRSIKLTPPPASLSGFALERTRSFVLAADDEPETDILGILRAAHFDTAVIERLAAETQAEVEISLNVHFKHGKRIISLNGDEALALLRDVPEDELVIQARGVRKNRGVLERVSLDASVERKGNILDRRETWRALEEAAGEYRSKGFME